MVGPGGERRWCLLEFKSIAPNKNFSGLDAFCDENANINDTKPRRQTGIPIKELLVTRISVDIDGADMEKWENPFKKALDKINAEED